MGSVALLQILAHVLFPLSGVLCALSSRSQALDLNPKYRSEKFQCPHCQVASQQAWFDVDNSSNAANTILNHLFYDYRTRIKDYQQNAISAFIEHVVDANNRHMGEFVPEGFSVATCSTSVSYTHLTLPTKRIV